MFALFNLIATVITLYIYVLVASAILSWLVAFNVLNTSNRFVYMVGDFLYRITEPALRPIRRFLPDLGGIDISPIILLLILFFLRQFLLTTVAPIRRFVPLLGGVDISPVVLILLLVFLRDFIVVDLARAML
jgi:YggT family protein